MTTATDTFTAFLDTLAETLDLGSEERARRLHLSRFHLDHVVSATGGEPPERMRRRLLLERAAHRLLASDQQVVDIAFEAGFGSHEAFTRAFAREYGAAPSRWRQHPTRTQIEGASGVHFHPPGSLRLPTRRKVTPMDLMTRMIEHHVWLTSEMLERAARLDRRAARRPDRGAHRHDRRRHDHPVRARPPRRAARPVERRRLPAVVRLGPGARQVGHHPAPRARRGGSGLPRTGADDGRGGAARRHLPRRHLRPAHGSSPTAG